MPTIHSNFIAKGLPGLVLGFALLASPGLAKGSAKAPKTPKAPKVAAWELELEIRVDPPQAVLVIGNNTVAPLDGHYMVKSSFFPSTGKVTPLLRAPGYGDLALPEVSAANAAAFHPDGPYTLPVRSVSAAFHRYPWAFAMGIGLLGLGGVLVAAIPRRAQATFVHLGGGEEELTAQTVQETPVDPLIGRQFGRYQVTEFLGSGGMATVYKALPVDNMVDSEAVAIKVIRPDQVSPDFQQRFEREIRVSMKLNHPNVLRIIDWETEKNYTFLVMEYIDGVPLSQKIPQGGLGIQDAMRVIPSIVEALAYAHSLGIVHRDLKPENVMISSKGRIKLMDFGLARNQEVHTVTVQGVNVGTPQYMAPEQVLRGPGRGGLTDSSDQYSLAIMIFELLCGRRPFEYDEPLQLLMMHMTVEPPKITSFRSDVPVSVEEVISKMLAKAPEDRYPSVKDAGAALLVAAADFVPSMALSLEALQKIAPPRAPSESTEQTRHAPAATKTMPSATPTQFMES